MGQPIVIPFKSNQNSICSNFSNIKSLTQGYILTSILKYCNRLKQDLHKRVS